MHSTKTAYAWLYAFNHAWLYMLSSRSDFVTLVAGKASLRVTDWRQAYKRSNKNSRWRKWSYTSNSLLCLQTAYIITRANYYVINVVSQWYVKLTIQTPMANSTINWRWIDSVNTFLTNPHPSHPAPATRSWFLVVWLITAVCYYILASWLSLVN